MMIIVDGTGAYKEREYEVEMKDSFCQQLSKRLGIVASNYYTGPGLWGYWTADTAKNACELVQSWRKAPVPAREKTISLAGYSRGGAAVIQIAKWLNNAAWLAADKFPPDPIPIKAMFLFDPVDRDVSLDGDRIPSNVATCYVAFRDQT